MFRAHEKSMAAIPPIYSTIRETQRICLLFSRKQSDRNGGNKTKDRLEKCF